MTSRLRAHGGEPARHGSRTAGLALSALILAAACAAWPARAAQPVGGAWFAAPGRDHAARNPSLAARAQAQAAAQRRRPAHQDMRRSLANFNSAAASIAAQQAAQRAARERAQAQPSDIPDGLGEGGLKVDESEATRGWTRAKPPTQRRRDGKTEVTIRQTGRKAILNWETFNVGRDTTVRFDQRGGNTASGNDWAALNRVNDPRGRPSRIAGTIEADGAVYLINRNGVIFHGTSQVDTRTLLVSSLLLSDRQFRLGINNPQTLGGPGGSIALPQFGEFPGRQPAAGEWYSPGTAGEPDRLGGVARFEPGAPPGRVEVQAGAQLSAHGGGKVMLFAPKVSNAGSIAAADGQVILAAGENVYLKTPAGNDPNGVRGLDVAVSAVPGWAFDSAQLTAALGAGESNADAALAAGLRDVALPAMARRAAQAGYRVDNTGMVQAERGNITLQGREVRQDGALAATTALNNRNGSILLRAWEQGLHARADSADELLHWTAGTLTLDTGSITRILPDAGDSGEIEAAALPTRYRPGWVGLYGQRIDVRSQAGVLAPSGTIDVQSAASPLLAAQDGGAPRNDGSRIDIAGGAFLSAAGLQDRPVPMSRNFIEVELRTHELRDSPLQAGSWLNGETFIVDRRAGGVFADGPMAGVQWVETEAGGGAYAAGRWVGTPLADVTGWIGVGKTDLNELSADAGTITLRAGGRLVTHAGSLLDVSGGSVRYADGVNTGTLLRGSDGRVYGMDRAMPDMAYVGLAGRYVRQHARWGVLRTWFNPLLTLPRPEPGYTEGRSAGAIRLYAGDAMALDGDYWGGAVTGERQRRQAGGGRGGRLLVGGDGADRAWSPKALIIGPAGASARTGTPDGNATRLSDLALSRSGMSEIVLTMDGGDFLLARGARLDLGPGASFSVTGTGPSAELGVDGVIRAPGGSISLQAPQGTLSLGARARLDAAGLWINAWRDAAAPAQWALDGGAITLAAGELAVDRRAVLDVSGGGRVDADRQAWPALAVGDAGSLTLSGLTAGADPAAWDLRAYAAGAAGRLSLATAAPVQLGGSAASGQTLRLPAGLFGERGFGSVSVRSEEGGITVPGDAAIMQRAARLDIDTRAYYDIPTGARLAEVVPSAAASGQARMARRPAGLSLETGGGPIDVLPGALLAVDVGGGLSLAAQGEGAITVAGTLQAPAGRIALSAARVSLAPGAQLIAAGVPLGRVSNAARAAVLDGGAVDIASTALRFAEGAVIDVSGAHGATPGAPGSLFAGRRPAPPVVLTGSGGSIRMAGAGLVAGTLAGAAGGPGGAGGRVEFVLDAPGQPGSGASEGGDAAGGALVLSARMPAEPSGSSLVVRPGSFLRGGFADLALGVAEGAPGRIRLDGVRIAMTRSISLPGTIVAVPGTASALHAPYISLAAASIAHGQAGPDAAPASGDGASLTLSGSLIDVGAPAEAGRPSSGAVRITGFDRTVLQAGEIRLGGPPPLDGAASGDGGASAGTAGDGAPGNGTASDNGTAGGRPVVELQVDGRLLLHAGQVYPATAAEVLVRAGDAIAVQRFGPPAAAAPLSAGGVLRLAAPVIQQDGVLRAPLGQIALEAAERLSLGSGSITSVSGMGVIAPYGTLVNGEHWRHPVLPAGGADPEGGALAAPPEKRITLQSPSVALARGATVDIAGGGDLYAWEFTPGPGGSHDVLTLPGTYAILPGLSGVAPAGSGAAGSSVWLAGGQGLAPGWYALLPARYALLPGGYAVQAAGGPWTGSAAAGAAMADGSLIVQGRRGNTLDATREASASAWRVMPGDTVRRYSGYNEALANDFFSSADFQLTQYRLTGQNAVTPRLPRDGGAVVFDATRRLQLAGTLRSQPDAGGRGGLVDIAGEKIAIVGAERNAADLSNDGYLVIDAAGLADFGAASLLVGGRRQGDPQGLRLDVTASDIVVRNGEDSALYGPEIILAASEQVALEAGSVVRAQGRATGGAGNLVLAPRQPGGAGDGADAVEAVDWGALVRVANGDAVRAVRQNVDTSRGGLVRIGPGAVLAGGASLLIDATRTTELAGSARIAGADLSVAAGRIGFGGGSVGMVLDDDTLVQLADSERLTLHSYSSFDFHRSFDLGAAGLASLTFDGAVFAGHGARSVVIRGDEIALLNTSAAAPQPPDGAGGAGAFTLDAGTLVLGAGRKTITGFADVTLAGRDRILGQGTGGIATEAALTLRTPLLTGGDGANQSIATQRALRIQAGREGPMAAYAAVPGSPGSRLSLAGASVRLDSRIAALGGSVEMIATGGDLVVGGGARIEAGGFAERFFDVTEYADAGRVTLASVDGDVDLRAGSVLDLSAHPGGGSAGTLSLAAFDGGTVRLDGEVSALAGTAGRGGAFALDIGGLPRFNALSRQLNAAGFSRSRQFRIREGSVVLDGLTTVQDFTIAADRGSIRVAGAIDARAPYGGSIRITGGDGVELLDGARLRAGATEDLGSGRVTLEAAGGWLDVGRGVIDVAGGEGGRVVLRAPRRGDNRDVLVSGVQARMLGASAVTLEGARSYEGASVDALRPRVVAEAAEFMRQADAIADRLDLDGEVAIASAIDIRSEDDLVLDADWNLRDDFAGFDPGTLTLRAGGDLLVAGNLSDGFDAAERTGALLDAPSWNLRLVAGADLDSADALALRPLATQRAGSGSIRIGTAGTAGAGTDGRGGTDSAGGAGSVVRTGTGDIAVRAGRDLVLAHENSAIYTAGRRDRAAWADFTTADPEAAYGVDGGHLDVAAQGSIEAQAGGQGFSGWLARQGNVNELGYFGDYADGTGRRLPAEQPSWWVDYGAFGQGVGALGGGNVTVEAGGDLRDLLVALPTTMRMRGGRSPDEAMAMEVRNGGALSVDAGGAIRGGQYYVARGVGDIHAGETGAGGLGGDAGDPAGGESAAAPVLALGDAVLNLYTAGELRLQSVVDPLLMRRAGGAGGAYMSGYTNRSALRLVSTGGNVVLVGQPAPAFGDPAAPGGDGPVGQGGNRYPARLSIAALSGSVELQGPVYVMPGEVNDVRLMARRDVRLNTPIEQVLAGQEQAGAQLFMSLGTPQMMPSPYRPGGDAGYSYAMPDVDRLLANRIGGDEPWALAGTLRELGNPAVLPLAADLEPSRLYAAQGSILGLDLTAAEQSWIRAGVDIRGVRVAARNLRASDTTLLQAGNDILAMAPVRAGAPAQPSGSISIQGPGELVLSAGRDVYADTLQAISLGNQRYDENNRPVPDSQVAGLPQQGAAITVMAGMAREPAYDAFLRAYLDPAQLADMPGYLKAVQPDGTVLPLYLTDAAQKGPDGGVTTMRRGLVSFIREITGRKYAPLEAWRRFQLLPQPAQQRFLRQVYLLELREAGRGQKQRGPGAAPLNGGYNRGYAAIETLFPGGRWQGDVAANSLMLRTMSGGDISVLTPGGGLQVAALAAPVPPGYGLATLGSGNIGIYARDDVEVNRSRILSFAPQATPAGSDQIIWSTLGDIDAGRGAKTVRVPSAPELSTDLDGNTVLREKADMSGSGIGTVGDGALDLIAPDGTINFGDAGARAAGGVNVAALRVLNAANVQARGGAAGFADTGASVGNETLAVAGAVAARAAGSAAEMAARQRAEARRSLPSIISVQILAFGEQPPLAGGGGAGARLVSGYAADSVVRVLSLGRVPADVRAMLTPGEQARLQP